jgi:hypothetical protein
MNKGKAAMNDQNSHRECLEVTAGVLIRCFVGGVIFLLIWFLAFVAAQDWMYRMHTQWFSITREHFALAHYCLMGATKLFIVVAFLIPYVCLRLVLKKKA